MRNTINKVWKNDFFKGGALITISSFLANILNYFFSVLAAHALGPSGFGEISALFSYTAVFSIPMMVMSLIVINKIGSKGEGAKPFARALQEWFLFKLRKWWFLGVPAAIAVPLVPGLTNLAPASGYALLPFITLNFLLAFYTAVIQGLQFFFWASLIGVLASVLKLAGAVLVIGGIDGLTTVIVFLLLSSLIPLVASYAVAKQNTPHARMPSDKINKRLAHAILNKYVIFTFLSILAVTLFNNADVIFVKKYFSAQEAGIYGSWSLFSKIILYLMGPLSLVSFIFFSDKNSEKSHERVLNLTLIILVFIGIVSYIFYRFLSVELIRVLFGSKFNAVAPYMAGASLFGTFYTTTSFINNYFLAKKSNFSLMLFGLIPVYFILLFIIPKTLGDIISLNIYFSGAIMSLYIIAYCHRIFYNGANGKKRDRSLRESYHTDL